jgi:hypothetical protein
VGSAGRAKRDREKVRQERAALKRARRQGELGAPEPADDAEERVGEPAPQHEVLAALALLHKKFDDGGMDFEEFEAAKSELIGRLDV